MRITKKNVNISYNDTKQFFKNRANKFNKNNPYSVTMYQDNNQELVKERNAREVKKLLPLLQISPNSKILDIGCGIGRWADALPYNITEYCGIDFSEDLVQIANSRNSRNNFFFLEGAINEIEKILLKNNRGSYNTILMMGILMYLNDKDMITAFEQLEKISDEHSIVCIREPIALTQRLTLKDFFSEELDDNYNAIYRTRQELQIVMEKFLLQNGFYITNEGFLFDETELNNRKETAQYYYIFER